MNTKQFQLLDFTSTSAAKKPSPKAVQKAAAILKTADKAKADDLKTQVSEALTEMASMQKEIDAAHAVSEAQISKLNTQIDKIQTKAESAYLKGENGLSKKRDRIQKLISRLEKHGGKVSIPANIKVYFEKPAADLLGSGKSPKSNGKVLSLIDGPSRKKSKSKKSETEQYVDDLVGKKPKKKRPMASTSAAVLDPWAKEMISVVQNEQKVDAEDMMHDGAVVSNLKNLLAAFKAAGYTVSKDEDTYTVYFQGSKTKGISIDKDDDGKFYMQFVAE